MRNDLVGKKFGLLTIIEMLRYRMCEAVCDCGWKGTKRYDHIESGRTSSCGCSAGRFVSEAKIIHGGCKRGQKEPEFCIWSKMRQRCDNPADKTYARYGGRGIRVCDRWQDYALFRSDMGTRPTPEHQIDRINNEGNYEPSNCRWATRKEQCRNRRTSRFITKNGKTLTVAGWADVLGIPASRIGARLYRGCSDQEALHT